MINEQILISGKLRIELFDSSMIKKSSVWVDNLVTTVGKNMIAARIQGTSNLITHIAMGSGVTTAAVGQTALGTELARSALSTPSVVTTNTVTYTAQFNPGVGTGAITEAGLFDAASSGQMPNRATFAVQNKASGDTMVITWVLTVV